jgi:hypothetical protein
MTSWGIFQFLQSVANLHDPFGRVPLRPQLRLQGALPAYFLGNLLIRGANGIRSTRVDSLVCRLTPINFEQHLQLPVLGTGYLVYYVPLK